MLHFEKMCKYLSLPLSLKAVNMFEKKSMTKITYVQRKKNQDLLRNNLQLYSTNIYSFDRFFAGDTWCVALSYLYLSNEIT